MNQALTLVRPERGAPSVRLAMYQPWQKLFMAYVILLFVEGILRKWVLPGLATELFLVKDLVLILTVLAYARSVPTSAHPTILGFLIVLVFALIQLVVLNSPIVPWVVGVRGMLMFGAAVLIAKELLKDLAYARMVEQCIVLCSLVQLPLMLLQLSAGPSARINRVLASDGSDNIGISGDVLRPTGTFTSSAGLSLATAIALALVVGMLLIRRERSGLLPTIAFPILLCMTILLGSRTALVYAAATVPMGFVAGILCAGAGTGRPQWRSVAWMLLAGSAAVALISLTQSDFLVAFQERLSSTESEDKGQRLLTDYFGWVDALRGSTLLGRGFGASANFAVTSGVIDRSSWIESDLSRTVLEGGFILGTLIVAARLGGAIVLLARLPAFIVNGRHFAPLAVPTIAALASGPILGQGTVGGLIAVSLGLMLGAGTHAGGASATKNTDPVHHAKLLAHHRRTRTSR